MKSIEEMIEVYRAAGRSEGDIADMVVDRLKEASLEDCPLTETEIVDAW
jgi:hypothetical protein